mmetsp:Transcript_65926/g.110679  ORF Transcript_65926/g.110679 Transcript_65926/m.110679 type:complete len:226 (-) Transcript_65926:150-827(-)
MLQCSESREDHGADQHGTHHIYTGSDLYMEARRRDGLLPWSENSHAGQCAAGSIFLSGLAHDSGLDLINDSVPAPAMDLPIRPVFVVDAVLPIKRSEADFTLWSWLLKPHATATWRFEQVFIHLTHDASPGTHCCTRDHNMGVYAQHGWCDWKAADVDHQLELQPQPKPGSCRTQMRQTQRANRQARERAVVTCPARSFNRFGAHQPHHQRPHVALRRPPARHPH